MGKTLLGGLSLLNDFNERGKNNSIWVGGNPNQKGFSEKLNFVFSDSVELNKCGEISKGNVEDSLCNAPNKPRKENIYVSKCNDSINRFNSIAYKHNQNIINDQVGVDASRRLLKLKIKQNVINNDCPSTAQAKGIFPSNSKFIKNLCEHHCGSCNYGYKNSDFKVHTLRNGLYERYYLKRGRTMLTQDERDACGLKCNCDSDLNWKTH